MDGMVGDGRARFDGRVALVTGGGRGLGRAVATRLAEENAAVAILALHEQSARTAAASITSRGGKALALWGDVAQEAAVRTCIDAVVHEFGRLDILVNNAGVIHVGAVTDMSVADWDRVLAVNLRGAFLGCREAARQMITQGTGGR